MKTMKLMGMMLLMATLFVACKKDKKTTPSTTSIEGKWVGKMVESNTNLNIVIEQPDVFKVMHQGNPKLVAFEGEWKLVDNDFTAQYSVDAGLGIVSTISYKAKFENQAGKLKGTIANSASPNDPPKTFYLNKQP